jgi:hypothetical protein
MITNMYLEIKVEKQGSSELCYVGMSYNDWNILLRLFLDIYQAYHLVGLFFGFTVAVLN